MKKIVGIIAAVTMAASVFAVDFNARVYMAGNIADGTIDIDGEAEKEKCRRENENETEENRKDVKEEKEGAVNFWKLNKTDQKDSDALVLSANGDKAGAQFQMWYNYDGSGGSALKIRSTSLWFKPIDMLKVTIGDVNVGTYNEMIDYWKVASGEKAATHQTYTWSSYATVSGAGLSVEATPIDGLWLSAGVVATPDSNLAQITFDDNKENETYGAYGVAAKYNLSNLLGLPMTAAVSWRDAGKDSTKILAIGADYGNNFAAGLYAMMNVRLRFEDYSYKKTENDGSTYEWTAKNALSGIVFDNYFKYSVGALKVQARLPITVRGLVKDMTKNNEKASAHGYDLEENPDYDPYIIKNGKTKYKYPLDDSEEGNPYYDPSYMSYEVKVTYAFDSFNAYLDIENDNACIFRKTDFAKTTFLNMNVQTGVSFNVGTCALDVGLNIDVPNVIVDDPDHGSYSNIKWSIPFTASVAF